MDAGRILLSALAGFAGTAVTALFGALLTGMLTTVVAADVLGPRSTLSATWATVRPRLLPLLWLTIATGVLEAVGLVLFVAPGVWLWGIWAVVVPVFMMEHTGVRAAMGRSRALVRGTFWRVWGIRAVVTLMIGSLSGALAAPFTFAAFAVSHRSFTDLTSAAHTLPTSYVVISAIGSVIATTISAPITAAFTTLQYVDLRMRKENLTGWLRQESGTG